jgi:hypothetical protein
MRLGLVCIGLLVAVAAQGQRNKDDDRSATQRACSVEECFFERDVRDFEVIDQTHLIVYTGSQRCAFHIEVRGTFCDLTFAPELYFSRVGELPDDLNRGINDPFGTLETSRSRRDLRICTNDLNVQVHGGPFTESVSSNAPPDRFGNPRVNCQISTVESITDDQLVELFVARRVIPPLPPMGAGEIEVGEQEEDEPDEGRDAASGRRRE